MLSLFLLVPALVIATWWFGQRRLVGPGPYALGWVVPLALAALAAVVWPSWLVLRKLIGLWLQPTALIFVLLVAACLTSTRGTSRRLLLAATLLFGLVTTPWLANQLLSPLECPFWNTDPLAAGEAYDAVLVLGGGATWGPRETPQFSTRGDRLRLPAALYKQGLTPLLVISGSSLSGKDATTASRVLWSVMGVPESAVLSLPAARNTAQEMDEYKGLIARKGWQRVGIVTSAAHMRRALILAQGRGLELHPLPADFLTGPPERKVPFASRHFLGLIPSGSSLQHVEIALWEYLGLMAARVSGD